MRLQMTARNWLLGAGTATLLVAGGLMAGPIAGLARGDADAKLSEQEAVEIAVAEYPDATALRVELEHEDGVPVYEINLSNGYELEIDGDSGAVLETERDDDDWNENGKLDDGARLLPDAAITVDEAVNAAQNAAEGRVGEVELENYRGDLTFTVEVGSHDVVVDAMSGEVLSVEADD